MTFEEFDDRVKRAGPLKTQGGDVAAVYESAHVDRAWAEEGSRPFGPGDAVLDLGCGFGRLAAAFAGTGVAYSGVDVSDNRLAYARKVFAGVPACSFVKSAARNGRYNPGGADPTGVTLPFPAGSFVAVFAISLFTHIPEAEVVAHYLAEVARVTAREGVMVSTWLAAGDGLESTARRARHAVSDVRGWLDAAGFDVLDETGSGTEEDHLRILSVRKGETP